MNKLLRRGVLLVMMGCVAAVPAFAQKEKGNKESLECRDNWHSEKLVNHCEIKEQTLPATDGTVAVDGMRNGGVSVKGWERNETVMSPALEPQKA